MSIIGESLFVLLQSISEDRLELNQVFGAAKQRMAAPGDPFSQFAVK